MKILIITSLCFFSASAFCNNTNIKASGLKLEKNMVFRGQNIGGKYQIPDESLTTVENEKVLTSLIKPPEDFNSRIKRTKESK